MKAPTKITAVPPRGAGIPARLRRMEREIEDLMEEGLSPDVYGILEDVTEMLAMARTFVVVERLEQGKVGDEA